MALKCKKINDKYCDVFLYYRIEGIDFQSANIVLVFLKGYTMDDDKKILDNKVFTFEKSKGENLSYEEFYNLLKELPEFEGSEDV